MSTSTFSAILAVPWGILSVAITTLGILTIITVILIIPKILTKKHV